MSKINSLEKLEAGRCSQVQTDGAPRTNTQARGKAQPGPELAVGTWARHPAGLSEAQPLSLNKADSGACIAVRIRWHHVRKAPGVKK